MATMTYKMKPERFAYEEEAREFAAGWSKQTRCALYVVESPSEEFPTRRFVVDDTDFIRAWERLVATYTNGVEEGGAS